VLGEDQGRAKVTLEISERAAGELAEYTRWVEQWSGIAAGEAKFKTVDFALREIFRRDHVWQAKRRTGLEPEPAKTAQVATPTPTPTPTPTSRPTAAPSPSLPPPSPREPRG
jgi:hypothetical protein